MANLIRKRPAYPVSSNDDALLKAADELTAATPATAPQSSDGASTAPPNEKLKRIGDWIFGETLGQGSFGKVKLAHHAKTKEKVAIKIVDKSGIANVEDVERVYRETFILTTLKHVNIIKLFEVLDTPKSIMLVMEYAGGGELFSYVSSKNRLSELESCRLFQQIIAGVEYCHRAKIIHRDLKLENILLDKNGQVKIADFGLSNSIKFGQKMDTSCGTPSYTCPEQIMGKKYVGNAADIWSLGVILFAMICGFLPFESNSIPSLFKKIKNRAYKCPDYISKEACDLIASMLTIDPDKRSTIAELRNHPWMLMEYTELADAIEAQKPVTPEMVSEARIACMAVGDDSSANSNSSSQPSSSPPAPNARNKYGHQTNKSNGGGLATGKATPISSPDPSTSTSSSPLLDDEQKDDLPHHAHSGSSGGNGTTNTSGGGGQPMGVRPRERERVPSGGGTTNGALGVGTKQTAAQAAAQAAQAKGFRDVNTTNRTQQSHHSSGGRQSPPTHSSSSSAGPTSRRVPSSGNGGGAGGLSIFDKLSVRTTDPPASTSPSAGVPQNSRYPRFSPNPSPNDGSTPGSGGNGGGVRFPPITHSPGISPPLDASKRIGASGRPSIIGASSTADGGAPIAVRTRRPSEFGGGGGNIPSYMQPTENAHNHLLASEREEREKAEETGTPGGGRMRGRSSVIHATSPVTVPLAGKGGHRLQDVNETLGHTTTTTSTAAGGPRPSVIKTPRTRDLTGGGTPSYMIETNSSRQRGGHKTSTDL